MQKKIVLDTEIKFCYFSLRLMFEALFADKYLKIYPRYQPLFSLDLRKNRISLQIGSNFRYAFLRNSVQRLSKCWTVGNTNNVKLRGVLFIYFLQTRQENHNFSYTLLCLNKNNENIYIYIYISLHTRLSSKEDTAMLSKST